MSDQVVMSKVDALFMDLSSEGVSEAVFVCTNSDGMLGVKYMGDPKLLVYLTSVVELNILDASMGVLAVEQEEE